MSENLDLLRSLYAAQARGDFSSAEWAHPEVEFEFADGPSPGTATGVAAMARVWHEFVSVWEDLRIEAKDYRKLDEDGLRAPEDAWGKRFASNPRRTSTSASTRSRSTCCTGARKTEWC